MAPDERRAALVDVTLQLLREHGRGVTTRQIAEAAGVAEGTIFRVVDSKEQLVDAAPSPVGRDLYRDDCSARQAPVDAEHPAAFGMLRRAPTHDVPRLAELGEHGGLRSKGGRVDLLVDASRRHSCDHRADKVASQVRGEIAPRAVCL